MIKIKKCPFCGRSAELRHNKEGFSYVLCANDGCYVRTDGHLNDESAIQSWNTRIPVDDVVEALEELKEMHLTLWRETDDVKQTQFTGLYMKAIQIVKEIMND